MAAKGDAAMARVAKSIAIGAPVEEVSIYVGSDMRGITGPQPQSVAGLSQERRVGDHCTFRPPIQSMLFSTPQNE